MAKAGVMLLDLSPKTQVQSSLLPEEFPGTGRDHSALMEAVDRINQRWGKGAVSAGSAMKSGDWRMKQERRTPNYTTQLEDAPLARA